MFFVLLGGCAGAARSQSLPSVLHVFDPITSIETKFYKATNAQPPICPFHSFLYEGVTPSKFGPDAFEIPHKKMVADNERCGRTGEEAEHMLIVPGKNLISKASAGASGSKELYELSLKNGRFRQAFQNLANKYVLAIGIEMADRYCGSVLRWRKDSFHILLQKTNTEFDFGKSAWISPGESGMLSYSGAVKGSRSELCIYKNSTDPGFDSTGVRDPVPTGSPLPRRSPVPSPSPYAKKPTMSPSTTVAKSSSGLSKSNETTASSSTSDKKSTCFPASARIEMESGLSKNMDELSIGDVIRVGPIKFSTVFMFTHKLSDGIKREFTKIQVESGESISATTGHYIVVNGALKTANSVKVGDLLTLASGEQSPVTYISAILEEGLYNPQTQDGHIVVDGIIASTYTSAVHPAAAHGLLAPLRFLYRYGLLPEWGILHERSYGLSRFAPGGVGSC